MAKTSVAVNEDRNRDVSLNQSKRKFGWDRTGRSDWTVPNGRECAKIVSGVVDLPSTFSYASLASVPHNIDNSEDHDNRVVSEVSAESDNHLNAFQAQVFSSKELLILQKSSEEKTSIPSSAVVRGQTTFDVVVKLKQYFTRFYELSSFPRRLQ